MAAAHEIREFIFLTCMEDRPELTLLGDAPIDGVAASAWTYAIDTGGLDDTLRRISRFPEKQQE